MATFETEVGSPNELLARTHVTKVSANTRMLNAFEDLQTFGSRYDHGLRDACTVVIEQIRNINLDTLPRNEWRRWEVTDSHTDVTLVVKVRRTG